MAGLRPQQRVTTGALIVELAGIRWHGLALRVPASGTRDGRLKHHRGHGIALSEEGNPALVVA